MSHAVIIIVPQELGFPLCGDVLDGRGCTLLVAIGPAVITRIVHWWELSYVDECS